MKILKMPLADGKYYRIQTFTVLEKKIMKKEYEKYSNLQNDIDKLLYELDEKGDFKKVDNKRVFKETITDQDRAKIEEITETVMVFGVDVLRKCLARHQPNFKKVDDPVKDKVIHEEVMNLVDETDIHNIVNFAFHGVYVKEENSIEIPLPDIKVDDLLDK